jgi:hypothetical protein
VRLAIAVVVALASGCLTPTPYQRVTAEWTRKTNLRGPYQEVLQLAAIYKSPAWRLAHAEKDAKARGLAGPAREQRLAQAQADAAGPIEVELLVTTWDRRENDLDRGAKSVWRVRLIAADGTEVEPIEILKDRRPALIVRAEFPALGDFATPYVVKFPRKEGAIRVRVSSERGGVEVGWN